MTETVAPARSSLLTAYRVLAAVSVVLVLVLATMAGRSNRLFGTWDIEVHGWVGNLLFTIAVVMVVLALLTRVRGVVLGHAIGFAALCFAQVGLGYVGRETLEAAAWHIPNGVLIMGVAVAHLSLLLPRRPPS